MSDELFRLSAGCTIAYRYGLNLILADERIDACGSSIPFVFGRMRVDGLIVEKVALRVEADHLAACAESRVESEYSLLPERSRHEQLLKVIDEDADSLLVRLLFGEVGELRLDAGLDKSLVAVLYGIPHQFGAAA